MTTLNDGSADAGIPEGGTSAGDNGSNASGENPFAGLQDEGIREWIDKAGIKDIEGLARKAHGAEKLIGRSVQLPGDDATPEEWEEFHSKVSDRLAPKDATGYEFKLPDGLPENLPYDSEFADEFRAFAAENKVPKNLAAKLHDWFVGKSAGAFSSSMEMREQQAGEATKALTEAWGDSGSQQHKEAQEFFFKFVDGNGGDTLLQELQEMGAIDEHKQVFKPNVVIALAKAGRALYGEDSFVTDGRTPDRNPFADDTSDWGERQRLLKADPSLAKRLITSAGKDPRNYGLG